MKLGIDMRSPEAETNIRLLETYENQLVIDKLDLDNVLINQAELYEKVGQEAVNATSMRDNIEADLDSVKAALDYDVRQTAATAGERTTEDKIKNSIIRHPHFQKLTSELLEWSMLSHRWRTLLKSFEQRATMLGKLTNLYTSNYYGDVSSRILKFNGEDNKAETAKLMLQEGRRQRMHDTAIGNESTILSERTIGTETPKPPENPTNSDRLERLKRRIHFKD
jgi:hypothetical protein